jgi:hypothetical protein
MIFEAVHSQRIVSITYLLLVFLIDKQQKTLINIKNVLRKTWKIRIRKFLFSINCVRTQVN